MYSKEDLTWAEVEEADGATRYSGSSTRNGQAQPFTTQAQLQIQGSHAQVLEPQAL